ncbi:DNA-directed RNA polymerase subunit delta [Fictibacillus macauensis ZFHKF-1]|uniref:Probable DNA-directed RNA polymerase subunit delta n=1 Tax=Fictibacillus macauensis ZFHKF-1 TaxID=1196324 RepID=I8J6R6_9BACL|nr:DNA-directed RNA polymerase subunit delta [Fictibacillus macauensis]EIT87481.1 DNA-directed RNA polymerase subunit delta [Fictibacillus macauensis ZFHKF-1]
MSITNTYSKEELMEMSMVEIAFEVLKDEKSTVPFYDLVQQIKEMKGLTDEALERRLSYFYTDMNIDGRFVSLGDNKWGLKAWYPIESSEEELGNTNKPTKRKKVEDDDFDSYDDFEDEDFEELEVDALAEGEEQDADEDFEEEEEFAEGEEELDGDLEDEEDEAAEEELYEVEEEEKQ